MKDFSKKILSYPAKEIFSSRYDQKTLEEIGNIGLVLLRVDYNIGPNMNGSMLHHPRVKQTLAEIDFWLTKGASVLLVSHLARPVEGVWTESASFQCFSDALGTLLNKPVHFLSDWPLKQQNYKKNSIYLAENTRFLHGERSNCDKLAKSMLNHIDLLVMDAFSVSHRKHASTVGLIEAAETKGIPILLSFEHKKEIKAIEKIKNDFTKQNSVAFFGGKKITTKIDLVKLLMNDFSKMAFGGGFANTLLVAQGYDLGRSWYEKDRLDLAKDLLKTASIRGVRLYFPTDVVVSDANRAVRQCSIDDISADETIIDLGEKSVASYASFITAQTCVYWNGPMGIYEHPSGLGASQALAKAISVKSGYQCIGGGDTLQVLMTMKPQLYFSHTSMGGGAFMAYYAYNTSVVSQSILSSDVSFA